MSCWVGVMLISRLRTAAAAWSRRVVTGLAISSTCCCWSDGVVEGLFGVFDVAVRGSAMAALRCLAFAAVRCPPVFACGLDGVVRRGEGWAVGLTCLVGFGEGPGGGDQVGLQLRDPSGVGGGVGLGCRRDRRGLGF